MAKSSTGYYTPSATRLLTFIETPLYSAAAKKLIDDDKQREIEMFIQRNPKVGRLEAEP